MHDIDYLIKGIVIGFSAAAPMGPVNMLFIKRTLSQGRAAGFITGIGAVLADTVFGFVAAFGLTFITDFLLAHQLVFKLSGGILLVIIGISTFFARPERRKVPKSAMEIFNHVYGLMGDLTSAFVVTITNPITLLFFTAVFTGWDLAGTDKSFFQSLSVVMGISSGSMLWWIILMCGLSILRLKFNYRWLFWANRISGIIIFIIGIIFLISLIH